MRKKWMAAAALVLTAAMAGNMTAFAGQWLKDDAGWWWRNDDGSYPHGEWKWLDGNQDGVEECYCFDAAGYMYAGTTTPDGYTVNADGAWMENGAVKNRASAPAAQNADAESGTQKEEDRTGGAAVITKEEDQALKARLRAAIDEIQNSETAIVRSDTFIPGETYTGTAYYVSSSTGNDMNDGLTPETAWQNLSNTIYKPLQPGDAIFFKRGDIFRYGEDGVPGLEINSPGVTYSAYGEGPKPIITPSWENGTGAEKWELVYSDDTGKKIWKFYRSLPDTAMVVLGGGEVVVRRVYEAWTPETGYISCENDQFLMQADYSVQLKDRLYTPWETLMEDATFLCRPEVVCTDGVYGHPDGLGPVYVRYDAGNPGALFDSVEFAQHNMTASVWLSVPNIVLDNLSFRYSGVADIKTAQKEEDYDAVHDTIVQNCEFGYSGGCVFDYHSYADGGNTVFVHGDGIYSVVCNSTFRHNYFHDGAAITFECNLNETEIIHGFYYIQDNVMVDTMGISMDATAEAIQYLDDVQVTGNQIWHTGSFDSGGYRYSQGSVSMPPHHFGKCLIRDNVFYCTENGFTNNALLNVYRNRSDDFGTDPDYGNNVYVQHPGRLFAAFSDVWYIDDPDLKEKAAELLGDTTSTFYILPDELAE